MGPDLAGDWNFIFDTENRLFRKRCGEGRNPPGSEARLTDRGDSAGQWGGPHCPPGPGLTAGTDSKSPRSAILYVYGEDR
jgi:hypothetical protein